MPVRFTGFRDNNQGLMQALRVGHSGQTTELAIGATATTITVISPIVRVVGDVGCHLVWGLGTATLATTTDMLLPASVVEYQVVDHGKNVSAITATGGVGTLYITEVL